MKKTLAMLAPALLALSMSAGAQEEPFDDRFYVAPQVSWGFFDDQNDIELDDEFGYGVAIGKPITKWFNLEGYYFRFDDVGIEEAAALGDPEVTLEGYGLTGLFFPVPDAFRMFFLAGYAVGDYDVSGSNVQALNAVDEDADHIDVGLGYMHELNDYGLALRGEYRYRITDADNPRNIPGADLEDNYDNHVVSLYLQIPLGAKPVAPPPPPAPEPAPEPEPAPVAPVDTDGDGVPDNADQCPGTPAGTQVDAQGCPVKKAEPIILKGVNFEFNSAKLTSEATNRLDNVVNALSASEQIEVRIEGHTDSIGGASYNLKLSKERAASVRQYLIDRGIAADRLTSEGYGESQPIAANNKPNGADNPSGRAKNRRVELEVVNQ